MKRYHWVSKLIFAHALIWRHTPLVSCQQSRLDYEGPLLSYESHLTGLVKEYQERHRLATSFPTTGARYIITHDEADGGVGNTMPGIVSAFFLALVTNRVLLIERCSCFSYLDHGDIDFKYKEQVWTSSSILKHAHTCGVESVLLLHF
jgi:hypothetical protein